MMIARVPHLDPRLYRGQGVLSDSTLWRRLRRRFKVWHPRTTSATFFYITILAALALALPGCGDGQGFSLDKAMAPKSAARIADESMLAPEADVRRQALYEMSKWKDVDAGLVNLVGLAVLGEKDVMARAQAARTLGQWARPEGAAYLSVALAGQFEGLDFPEAREHLVKLGVTMPRTPDDSKFVRRDAAWALGHLQSDEAVKSLVRALQFDADADVRIECARTLRQHKHPAAAQGLLLGLADRDLAVRVLSAESLQYMTGQKLGLDVAAWDKFLSSTESPLADYGTKVKVTRSSAKWIDFSQEKKARIREIFSDLFPLERKEGPFD